MDTKNGLIQLFSKIKISKDNKIIMRYALLALGIGIILAGYKGLPGTKGVVVNGNDTLESGSPPPKSAIIQEELILEERLEQILSKIEGAGSVAVSITLISSSEYEYVINESVSKKSMEEDDSSGGFRTTIETTENGQLVMQKLPGATGEQPVIMKEKKPEVNGVLVVSVGAADSAIKAELTKAVQILLGVSSAKVNVVSGKGR